MCGPGFFLTIHQDRPSVTQGLTTLIIKSKKLGKSRIEVFKKNFKFEKLKQSKLQEKENYETALFERERFVENCSSVGEGFADFIRDDLCKIK
jgi:hypothetical protein